MKTAGCFATLMTLAASFAAAQPVSPYWAYIPDNIPLSPLWTSIVFDDGSGPTHYYGAGEPTCYFRWRNRQWEPLPTEGLPPDRLYSVGLALLNDGGGDAFYTVFRTITGGSRPFRWRNGEWSAMPLEFWQDTGSSDYRPMTSADLGNGMHIYGELPQGRICRWNGQSWDVIGQTATKFGGPADIHAMVAYHDGQSMALYVFGSFYTVNGAPALTFARWDGQTWTGPWPDGIGGWTGQPLLKTYDDGSGLKLYTNFQPAINGVNNRGLHRWDGTTWEFLGGSTASLPETNGLHVFDDGTGPGLYITGTFPDFGGVPGRSIVRYDGNGFHTVPGSNLWTSVTGYGVIRDERGESLLIRGRHVIDPPTAPTIRHSGLLVGCRVPTCAADCDADGRLNVRDFACFINNYAEFTPYANANSDNRFTVADFAAFLNRFAAGCP